MADVTLRFVGDNTSAVRAARGTERALGGVSGRSTILRRALLGVGVAAAGGLAFGLKKALDLAGTFEQTLNTFEVVAGATGDEMERVSALSKELGADLTLPGTSAADAASAMTELAKGGLSVRDAMDAARGTLQLSAAAQIENAEAATIVADALNSFNLAGDQAGRVSDLLAASANATTAEMGDMAAALKQSSAVAAQLGIPIEEVVTELGLLANAGIKGSDAGTSLRTMLLRLGAPTAEAAAAIDDLGVNVFNAHGEMLPMPKIIDQFATATKGMSDEQRTAAFQTIFGTDAIRAANIVLRGGLEPHDKMADAVGRQGAAAELAAAKMKGYKGALEGFKSTVETFAITIGEKLLPLATEAVGALSDMVGFLDEVANAKSPEVAVRILLEGAEDLAGDFAGKLRDALFGATTRKPIKLPSGQILEWDERSTDGLVKALGAAIAEAIRNTDWSEVPSSFNEKLDNLIGENARDESDQKRFVRWIGLDPDHDYGKDLERWFRRKVRGAFVDGLKPDFGATRDFLDRQLGGWDEGFSRFAGRVRSILSRLGSWIASNWQQILLGAVLRGAGPLGAAGSRLGKAVVDGVINWIRQLPGRVGGLITSAAASVGGHIGEFFRNGAALGQALVSGVISGLASLFSRVAGAISGAVSSAVGWARGHIGSTAEEYAARQLGHPLAEGVAGGFESRSRDMRRRMARSLRDSLPGAHGIDVGGAGVRSRARAGGGGVYHLHFHGPVGEPERFAMDVGRAMERLTRTRGISWNLGS